MLFELSLQLISLKAIIIFFILISKQLQFCWFGMVAERPRVSLAFSLRIFALVYCAVKCPLPPSPIIRIVLEQIPIFEEILLEIKIRFWNGGTKLYIPVGIAGKGGITISVIALV